MSPARLPADCPAPVAMLPLRGSLSSVTFSMPRSVTFSMPIDTTPPPAPRPRKHPTKASNPAPPPPGYVGTALLVLACWTDARRRSSETIQDC